MTGTNTVRMQLDSRYSSHKRLFECFALSLLFHAALITWVGGTPQVRPHRPLVVDLQYVAQADKDPIAIPHTTPETAADRQVEKLLPQTPSPEPEREARAPATPKPPVDLPVPFDSYLSLNEVDVRAEPVNDPHLIYPSSAYMRRIPGVVRLNLFINEQGRLDRVELLEAKPTGIFEQAALEAVNKLHFRPATRYGTAVKSRKTIEVVFDPSSTLDQSDDKTRTPTAPSATEK